MTKLSTQIKDLIKHLTSKLKLDSDLGEIDKVDVNDPESIKKILDKYQPLGYPGPSGHSN
ncbi:hypothetical protein HDV01_007069, partial [Terramyces sp. JEL0728]